MFRLGLVLFASSVIAAPRITLQARDNAWHVCDASVCVSAASASFLGKTTCYDFCKEGVDPGQEASYIAGCDKYCQDRCGNISIEWTQAYRDGKPWCKYDDNYDKYDPRRNQQPSSTSDFDGIRAVSPPIPDSRKTYDPVTNPIFNEQNKEQKPQSFLPTDEQLGAGGEFVAGLPSDGSSSPIDFFTTEPAGTDQLNVALLPDNSGLGAGEFIIPDNNNNNQVASTVDDGALNLALGPQPDLNNVDSFGTAQLGGTGSDFTAFVAPESTTDNNQFGQLASLDGSTFSTTGSPSLVALGGTDSGADFNAFAPVVNDGSNAGSFVANAGSGTDYDAFIS